MKAIRTLVVIFGTKIEPYEVPAFRGSLAERVGYEHEWFHNHNNQDKDKPLHYRYPLVQYKITPGKHPLLFFINQGVDEATKFFARPSQDLFIKGKPHRMNIIKMSEREFELDATEKAQKYRIFNWLALNQRNIREWDRLKGKEEYTKFLERILIGNIISFATGIGWRIEEFMDLKITEILRKKTIRFKSIQTVAFDVAFEVNVILPEWLGLGKGVSKGFGVLRMG